MPYQSKTYSLSDEVISWLGELKDTYGSVNKGLRAMRIIAVGDMPDVPLPSERPKIDPVIADTVIDNRPKNAYCKHCGSRFAGAKFATICPECKSSGHTNQPAECPRCGDGGTGGL